MAAESNHSHRMLVLAACGVLYISGLLYFAYYRSFTAKKAFYKQLDSRLYIAANATKHILADDFHDRAIAPQSITFTEELKNRAAISSFAASIGFPNIYTLIKKGDSFYFTAPSIGLHNSESFKKRWYFSAYENAPQEFHTAFDENKIIYTSYSDKWGHFRSIAVPIISPTGKKYLACADCFQSQIDWVLKKNYYESIMIAFFFGLLASPLFYMVFHYLNKVAAINLELRENKNTLEDTVTSRTAELEKARDELLRNREQLLMALQTGRISVFKWDLKLEQIEFTRTMVKSWEKFQQTRFSTRFFKRYIHPDDKNEVMRKLARYISGSADEFIADFRLKFQSGNWRWFHAIGKILERSKTGIGQIMVGIVEDITELKTKEAALQQAQKLEAVGQLAGGIAHDFNNMLQAISGYAEMIKMSLEEDDENQDCIDLLIEAAKKSQALVRQLLTFSRMSQENKENIDVNLSLEDAISMLRRLIGSNIELKTNLGQDIPFIYADAGQFEQIILNLCVNARDAMENQGTIHISSEEVRFNESFCFENPWAKSGHFVKVSVKDNGPGIPKKHLRHVFEPFFTTKEVGKGTGLGLAIVYGIIQKHKGFLHLASEIGKGTEFQLYFPASDIMAELKARTNLEIHKKLEGEETILLAEDAELVRNFAGRMLRKAGYKVLFAVDGQDAVEIFEANKDKIDILVFDIIMPRMTGKQAYEEIKKIRSEIPIVFCSGYHEEILDTEFYTDFKGGFLPKPYKTAELLSKIRELLDKNYD